jgi:uncharacterized protein (TIGR02453 family)
MGKQYFRASFFGFLRELKQNNNRPWFQANKLRYDSDVKEPMLEFLADFDSRLRKISRSYRADPRPVGGSMFRIYRDVRFSKDKSPYKIQAAASFHHAIGKDVHAPGFYIHLAPGEVFVGAGMWHPEPVALAKIRQAIAGQPAKWKRAIGDPKFAATYELSGDSLVRPPGGYDPNHPLIEDLKRKDFIAAAEFSEREATTAGFMDRYTQMCQAAVPLMRFLTSAMALPW